MKLTKIISYDDYMGYDFTDGIFDKLGISWLSDTTLLNTLYSAHSGEKVVSPLVLKVNGNSDKATTAGKQVLANLLNAKYLDNWNKIHEALTKEYEMIDNYAMTEIEGIKIDGSGNSSSTDSGSSLTTDSNTKTTDMSNTESSKSAETQSTTKSSSGSSDASRSVYAYDSDQAKPSDKNDETHSDTDNANSESEGSSEATTKQAGTIKDESTATTTDSRTVSGESTSKENTDRTLTRKGNIGVTTSQQMLESELKFRTHNLLDIMFKDIDKLLTIRVYIDDEDL